MSTHFSIAYDKEAKTPHLGVVLPESMRATEAQATVLALAQVFNEALIVAHGKNGHYGDAWRRQGWMGNLARIQSKVQRLTHMLWRDHDLDDANEPVRETAIDLINIAGFFIVNRNDQRKWR